MIFGTCGPPTGEDPPAGPAGLHRLDGAQPTTPINTASAIIVQRTHLSTRYGLQVDRDVLFDTHVHDFAAADILQAFAGEHELGVVEEHRSRSAARTCNGLIAEGAQPLQLSAMAAR